VHRIDPATILPVKYFALNYRLSYLIYNFKVNRVLCRETLAQMPLDQYIYSVADLGEKIRRG
jgi:hypothetical protein